jgi:glycosyltransferase involved in cell wall biosynthesis
MTILIFHQYFSTNKGSYGTRLYEFSKYWIDKGFKVKIVTSLYYKSDLKQSKLGKRFEMDGIDLIVLNIPISNKDYLFKRIYHFMLYSVFSIRHAMNEDCDLVMASSGPISTGIPALFARKFRKKPFIFEVRDLWPGVVEEIGIIKNKIILNFAYRFEKYCYRKADEIVALSPGMEEDIKSRFHSVKTNCVYNTANPKIFKLSSELGTIRKNIIYTGNIGLVNNSILLIKAAHLLKKKNRTDIRIEIIGDGQLKDQLINLKESLNLDNLILVDSMPKDELVNYLKSATASVIPLMDKKILDTSSPNKLYESLMSGIPVIQTTKGWIKDLLESENCGISVSPSDERELVDAIIKLVDNPDLRQKMSLNANRVALENFTTQIQANIYVDVFNRYN